MPALRSLSCNLRTTVSRSNDAVAEPDCSTVVLSFVTHTHPSKQVDGTPTVHALASRSRITRRPSSPTSPNETIRHKLHDVATAAAMTRRFVPIARDQPRFRRGFTAYGGLRAPVAAGSRPMTLASARRAAPRQPHHPAETDVGWRGGISPDDLRLHGRGKDGRVGLIGERAMDFRPSACTHDGGGIDVRWSQLPDPADQNIELLPCIGRADPFGLGNEGCYKMGVRVTSHELGPTQSSHCAESLGAHESAGAASR